MKSESHKAKIPPVTLPPEDLLPLIREKWVEVDTAILIIHGVGHQHPLETLDGFSRGIIDTLGPDKLRLEHCLAKKEASDKNAPWFDNYLSIRRAGDTSDGKKIDIYEYYWAPETEGQASFKDLERWVSGVTAGARKFYANNQKLSEDNLDESFFIHNGKFSPFNYWFCIYLIPAIIANLNFLGDFLLKLIYYIPIAGPILSRLFKSQSEGPLERVSNLLNDIAIYNTTDAKSRFFRIRNCILDGAVNSLRYLLEGKEDPSTGKLSFPYEKVLVCGHSLGSEIGFDAINRINHLTNQQEIKGYDCLGICSDDPQNPVAISNRLCGFVTFGSPLDKVAFFFRNQAAENEWVRAQMLSHFHGFKQREWNGSERDTKILYRETRLFDEIPWRNYWDKKDYISGSLDYYKNLTNIDCSFKSGTFGFTHSDYWACTAMFADILDTIVFKQNSAADQSMEIEIKQESVNRPVMSGN